MSKKSLRWQDQSACGGEDTNLWYPEKGQSPSKKAIGLCYSCPVKEACLEYAIENEERFGIWGGLTPNERKKIVNERLRRNLNGKPTAGMHSVAYAESRDFPVAELPLGREGTASLYGEHVNGSDPQVRTQGNEALGTVQRGAYDANGHSTLPEAVPVDIPTGVLQQTGVERIK